MERFLYYTGFFLFSKAFVYALGSVALFGAAAEGRRRPDETHLQPWRGFLAAACGFALCSVIEACGKDGLFRPVGRVCLGLVGVLAVYQLWLTVAPLLKARRARTISQKPGLPPR